MCPLVACCSLSFVREGPPLPSVPGGAACCLASFTVFFKNLAHLLPLSVFNWNSQYILGKLSIPPLRMLRTVSLLMLIASYQFTIKLISEYLKKKNPYPRTCSMILEKKGERNIDMREKTSTGHTCPNQGLNPPPFGVQEDASITATRPGPNTFSKEKKPLPHRPFMA